MYVFIYIYIYAHIHTVTQHILIIYKTLTFIFFRIQYIILPWKESECTQAHLIVLSNRRTCWGKISDEISFSLRGPPESSVSPVGFH